MVDAVVERLLDAVVETLLDADVVFDVVYSTLSIGLSTPDLSQSPSPNQITPVPSKLVNLYSTRIRSVFAKPVPDQVCVPLNT